MWKEKGRVYTPSLYRAIFRQFGLRYCLMGMFTFAEECILRIAQAVFMGRYTFVFTVQVFGDCHDCSVIDMSIFALIAL